jgi:hypothetical protein
MPTVLAIVGIGCILVGGFLLVAIFGTGARADSSGIASLAMFLAATPGFGLIGTGLLFLGFAELLSRLREISASAARTAAATEQMTNLFGNRVQAARSTTAATERAADAANRADPGR